MLITAHGRPAAPRSPKIKEVAVEDPIRAVRPAISMMPLPRPAGTAGREELGMIKKISLILYSVSSLRFMVSLRAIGGSCY